MKQIIYLSILAGLIAACNLPATPDRLSQESTPVPFPGTPAPAEIDAAPVDAPHLTSIRMHDELNGWGLAETALVRTNDGGVTWYDLTPPGPTELGYAVRGFFLDPDHAWILAGDQNDFQNSGTLYRTQDGGINWSFNTVPFGGGDLAFLNASDGWMMADLGVGAGSNAVAVFQTRDGGSTWTRTYINEPNTEGAGDSLPLGGLKYELVPLNMQTAWIGGVTYATGSVYLFRTDDGGGSWTPLSLTLPEGAQDSEIGYEDLQFVSSADGILAMRMTGAAYQLAVYGSHDGGDNWLLTPTLIPDGGSVDFLSAAEGVVWNGNRFYVTRDAANTWSTVEPDLLFGDTFAQMDFVNLQSGWVITYDSSGRYNLYKTADGGASWTSLFP